MNQPLRVQIEPFSSKEPRLPRERVLSSAKKPRVGISRCLLGEKVRYDGGHKRDQFLADTLGRFVRWVPVCPEVEAGLGTPREPMRLVGVAESPQLITINTEVDQTTTINTFSRGKIRELQEFKLDGYVFKKDSPSCGMRGVRVYNSKGMSNRQGMGLFAQAVQKTFPILPIEDEGRLHDCGIRENFIERVFCYHRWQNLLHDRVTRGAIVLFHTHHKYLLLAHSRPHYQQLGQLVASAKQYTIRELLSRYAQLFMEGLHFKATTRKHVNVLLHLFGQFKKQLTKVERTELQEIITDYHRGLTPLVVPLTLISHYVRALNITYLANQIYIVPHPKELMLRNHV